MMKKQPTYAIGTVKKFVHDGDHQLMAVYEHVGTELTAYYVASGRFLEKSWLGPERKRSRIEFAEDIALRYVEYGEQYTVNACARNGGAHRPRIVTSHESIGGLISFFRIREDLMSEWVRKIA